jgi:glucokinase
MFLSSISCLTLKQTTGTKIAIQTGFKNKKITILYYLAKGISKSIMNNHSKTDVTLAIDIGGTNTAFGYVNREGTLIASSVISTNSWEPPDKFFNRLFTETDVVFSTIKNKYKLAGIGIGAPNANYFKGTIEQPPNLKWETINVLEIIKKYYSVPCAITNDANAAAMGELLFGAAKGMKDFIVVTLGTGVGSGIVVNGELVYGHHGFAGEIGHTIYDPNGRKCGCGRKGCLETYVSAGGIRKTVYELLSNSTDESELRNCNYDDLTAKTICEAAYRGDKVALEAFDYTSKILGIKLADAVAYTNPEAIILFGGLSAAGDILFKPTEKYMNMYLLNIFKNKIKLLPSGLSGGNSAILGAAALIWNELEKLKQVESLP